MTPQKIVRKVKNKESNSIQASLKKMIIIIPVFNEGSNIQILLGTLSKKVPHANLLFVDDNSRDDRFSSSGLNCRILLFCNLLN